MEEISEEVIEEINEENEEPKDEQGIHNKKYQWFAVIAQSGMEKRAKAALEDAIKRKEKEDMFGLIVIPTKQKEVIDSSGKKKIKETKMTPGYMLVQMILDNNTFNLVRNIPRISGFLGASMSKMPPPIPPMEVDRMLNQTHEASQERAEEKQDFSPGEKVKVIEGPFTGFAGEIDEVKSEKKKLRVLISVFGRPTPVDLDYHMVEQVRGED